MSKIKKINERFAHYVVLSQSVFNKPYTSFSFTFKCRSLAVCFDSSSSWFIGDQALHQGSQISDSFKRGENHSQNGFIIMQDNGFTSRHFKEVKAHRAQTFVDSGHSQWRSHLTWKSGNSSQSLRCSHKVCSILGVGQSSSQIQPFQGVFIDSGVQG